MKKTFIAIAALLASGTAFAASPIDQRDADYQLGMESLQQSITAIDIAKRELDRSQNIRPVPGMRYDLLHAQLDEVKANLMQVVSPEERRMRYQELVPDSQFFAPPGAYSQMLNQ